MRLLRGRASSPERDRRVTAAMRSRTAETGVPALRTWTPHRQVAFGRRDARRPNYAAAREAAAVRGFPAVERRVGGRAVAHTGGTVAFALAVPIDDLRTGLGARYDDATDRVQAALAELGVDARSGEPADSFCPGAHSLRRGGKIAGIAQRVASGAALVAGVVIVAERAKLVAALDPVYSALSLPFDPDSVGSVADAGGPADTEAVVEALAGTFLDGDPDTVERAADVELGPDSPSEDCGK